MGQGSYATDAPSSLNEQNPDASQSPAKSLILPRILPSRFCPWKRRNGRL